MKINTHLKNMLAKRPAKRIKNHEAKLADHKNIAKRLRDFISENPNMSVSEFIGRSHFKNPRNKELISLLKEHFGDLKISQIKTKQLEYFYGMYTKDAKQKQATIEKIKKDPLQRQRRIIKQKMDFFNRYVDDVKFRRRVDLAIDRLKKTRVSITDTADLKDFHLSRSEKKQAFNFLKSHCPDLSYRDIVKTIESIKKNNYYK
jgi:hypothetical protein